MKKNLTFANGKLVLLVLLTLVSVLGCTPETVDPNPTPVPTPTPKPKPTITISASATELMYADTAYIDWSASANSVKPAKAYINGVEQSGLSGKLLTGALDKAVTYNFEVINDYGSDKKSVTINVQTITPVMGWLTDSLPVPWHRQSIESKAYGTSVWVNTPLLPCALDDSYTFRLFPRKRLFLKRSIVPCDTESDAEFNWSLIGNQTRVVFGDTSFVQSIGQNTMVLTKEVPNVMTGLRDSLRTTYIR